MTNDTIIKQLRTLQTQGDGQQAEVIEHAIKLIEQMGLQLTNLKGLVGQRFRPSSEKVAPGQMALDFISQLLWEAHNDAKPEGKSAPPEKDKEKRSKRCSKVKLLPVVRKDVPLNDAALACGPCGGTKTVIGEEVTRRIIYEPAKLYMLEEHQQKAACRPCGNGVVLAPAAPKLLPGSLASSSILAHLVVAKVVDALPIERVGKQLARHGAELAPSTLYDWFAQAGDEVLLLQPRLRTELLRSNLISLDDTPLPTKNPEHARNIQRGRLYALLGDIDRIAYCDYAPDWKGIHPRKVLSDFKGDIQGDGYAGITPLFTAGASPPQRVGCNDHARRKFVEALKLGDERARPVIDLYAQLYAVERQATAMTPAARRALRSQAALPVWHRLAATVEDLARVSNRKGPLGKAVTYWRAQRTTLEAYLRSGHLPISNAHVERVLRTVALLRKNSLFMGSMEAGPRYAALLTMALNCTLCGANPFDYFVWLFDRLAAGIKASQTLDLLPQRWLKLAHKNAA